MIIGRALVLIAQDVVGTYDLPEAQRGVGIAWIDVGMGALDRLAKRGPQLFSIIIRKSSEHIVKRLHGRSRRRVLSSPPEIPATNLRWSTRTNRSSTRLTMLIQYGGKMTELRGIGAISAVSPSPEFALRRSFYARASQRKVS